jgi:hypothetical protein
MTTFANFASSAAAARLTPQRSARPAFLGNE